MGKLHQNPKQIIVWRETIPYFQDSGGHFLVPWHGNLEQSSIKFIFFIFNSNLHRSSFRPAKDIFVNSKLAHQTQVLIFITYQEKKCEKYKKMTKHKIQKKRMKFKKMLSVTFVKLSVIVV